MHLSATFLFVDSTVISSVSKVSGERIDVRPSGTYMRQRLIKPPPNMSNHVAQRHANRATDTLKTVHEHATPNFMSGEDEIHAFAKHDGNISRWTIIRQINLEIDKPHTPRYIAFCSNVQNMRDAVGGQKITVKGLMETTDNQTRKYQRHRRSDDNCMVTKCTMVMVGYNCVYGTDKKHMKNA